MRTRLKTTTTTLASGTKVKRTTLVKAPDLEWMIQAEAVRRIKKLPGYGESWDAGVLFTMAADMNAARRGRQEATKAKAMGIAAGEPDTRFYLRGGALKMIEFKGWKTPISDDQERRHPLLSGLGFEVVVLRAKTIEEGAAEAVRIVSGWLAQSQIGRLNLEVAKVPNRIAANDNAGAESSTSKLNLGILNRRP